MADRKLQYIIEMIADDRKIRQQMSKWNWEDIMGTKGKSFGDMLADDAKYGSEAVKNAFNGLNIDWTKILGAKEVTQIEQAVTRAISNSRKELELFANKGDTAGIENIIKYVSALGGELKSLGSNFDTAALARGMGAFMKMLIPLSEKFETLANEPKKIEAAFDKLFNGQTLKSADQTINKIATAMATLGIDKSVVTNIKQARTEMDKLVKSSKMIKLDIDYGNLKDEDLLSILQKKYNNQTTDLSKLLGYEWGNLTMNMPDVSDVEKTKKHLLAILELEKKITSIDGKSPVDEYFAEDTGYDNIKELRGEFERLTDTAEKSVKETVNTLEKGVKTIQRSITEKLGKLSEVKIDLTLDEANKTEFKNSIDTFVNDLNSNKYGEINTVKVDLDLNEPTKTTNRGRPNTISKKQIEETKADIQGVLDTIKEEYNKADEVLVDLNKRHNEELAKNKNYDNEPQSARLKGSINKAEQELKLLEKSMASYNYLLSQMDDYEFAKSVVSDWKKFSSAAKNIRASQDKLLSDTRKWRTEMNDALKFRYVWKVDGTADEFDRLSFALTSMSEENPIKLMPDIDFMVNAIEEGLAGREINVKLAADGPIKATGGIVGNLGIMPITPYNNKPVTNTPPSPHKPVSKSQPQVLKQDVSKSEARSYVNQDVNTIIKYVEEQVSANKELNDSYLKMLKSVGITDREVSAYINNVKDKKIKIPEEVIKEYGSESNFLNKLKKTKETVNFNTKLPFYDAAENILKLKNVIDNNPNDEVKVKNASEQIKDLLIKSVVNSFVSYIEQSKKRFSENEAKINEQIDIKNKARQAYENDGERKKKRLKAMDSQKQIISELESNTAIADYEALLQLIEEAKQEGDKDIVNSLLKEEQKILPSIKQGYQDLIKARQELKDLEKEDPNDPNLLKIIDAEKKIASYTKSNEKIIKSRQAYENIGFPLNEFEELSKAKDDNAINNLIIDKILNKPNIVQSMGAKRRLSSAPDAIYLFDTMAQKLITKTIEMVQQAVNITQKTTEELSLRAINENMLGNLRDIAAKKTALASISNWGSRPQSAETFEEIRLLFADEINYSRQIKEGKLDKVGKNGEVQKYIPTDRDKAYIKFTESLERATRAADRFKKIYDSWSASDRETFVNIGNKEEWFQQKYKNPAEANKNYLLYMENDLAIKALSDSVKPKQENIEKGDYKPYDISKEITELLKGYVFRVTLVDDKGSHIVDVGTDKLVKQGNLSKPDKWYKSKSLNAAKFLTGTSTDGYNLPEDLGEIADIKVYRTPSGKRPYDQPSNVKTPIANNINKKSNNSRTVSEAKQLINSAKMTIDEAANTITTQEILNDSNEILETATQTLETINGQITNITGGVDVKKYREHLVQKRNNLKTVQNNSKKSNSTPVKPLYNKAFNEANEMIESSTRKSDVARQIAQNPFNSEIQNLFEGELPNDLKRLLEVTQQRESLQNILPKNREEAVEAQNKIRALQEEEKILRQSINQWADNVSKQRDKTIVDANKIKEQAAPELAKDYQNKIIDLVNQATSLSQQLEVNPDNAELKIQMQDIIDAISRLTVIYKNLLDKYNITTKGFLGNENQKKLDIAQKIYENPADQNLWSKFGKVPDAVKKASELLQRDSELTRQLMDLPKDIVEIDNELDRLKTNYDNAKQAFDNNPTKENRNRRGRAKKAYKTYKNKNEEYRNNRVREYRSPIEQERLQVAREYKKERKKILQWVKRRESSIGTGIFAGLGNSSKKFKNTQSVILGWDGSTNIQNDSTVDIERERERLNTEISQINVLNQQAEAQAQIVANARERVNLATRQLEIEKELSNASITSERKSELEAEYENNKVRASELGVRNRRFVTTSVDADKLQNAYLTVVSDLIDQQEESDKKISKLHSELIKEQRRLGYLEAERTPEAVAAGKRHMQDSAIRSAIGYRASELSNTNPEIYAQLREEVEPQYPITDFYDYPNPYERQEQAIQAALSKKAEEYVRVMMTEEEERKIINEAIVAQKRVIETKEAELQAERAHNNEIVTAREQYKLEGKITDEMIAARRNVTEEIKREAQIIHQHTNVYDVDYEDVSDDELLPIDNNRAGYDTHYQDYTGGQAYQYTGDGIYGIDTSRLATEDTLNAIYILLSGDTSRTGLSDVERKEYEEERASIRNPSGGGLGKNEPQNGTKETSESIMTIGKAIKIIDNAIGKSTAKTTVGMAKAYANKIHGNAEIVEAAKFLYNTPDSEITTKYGKSVKTKLKNFRDAWASNQQDKKPKVPVEPEIKPGAVAKEIKENVAETPAKVTVEPVADNPKSENFIRARFQGMFEAEDFTPQEYQEMVELLGEPIEKMVIASNQQAENEQKKSQESAQQVKNEQQKAKIVETIPTTYKDIKQWTMPDGQVIDDMSEDEYRNVLSILEYSDEDIRKNIEENKQQLAIKTAQTEEEKKQLAIAQSETLAAEQQLNNVEASKARAAEIDEILATDDKLKAAQSASKTASGGIIGAMNDLAKDNTLHQILEAIGEIAKRQVSRASGKGNSAQDLLMRLEGLRDLSVGQDKERVVYMDLNTGAITDSVEGQRDGVIYDTLDLLRKVYQGKIDLNAQVHTHGKSDNPDDQYFSEKDFATFKGSFDKGIKTQILVSEQGLTVLDLSSVEKLSEDTLTRFGGGKSAYDALLGNDLGIKYVTQTWNSLVSNPDLLVKLLGIKGVESKYTKEETRDSAVSGVLAEDAKEAADILQESTGRAIKKTVERVGAELMTTTEKTDAKGNKTWSNQINNKYEKAALATNKAFEKLGLTDQFGEGTEAQIALDNYREKYSKFIDLVNKFKQNPKQDGLQEEFDQLLPELDEAETKLNKLIVTKDKFIGNKEPITIFTQDQVVTASDSLKKVAIEQFAGNSDNMAFNGISETPNGTRLLVDVLKDGFISQYAIEVDKATGQVREFMMAETALVNAFQNVNKAMKQNKSVMANIAPADVTSAEQLQDFLNNANSPMWDAYKSALADMEKYTLDLLTSMKDGKSVSKEQEDYLMLLSEKVIRLGKDVQKTSGAFNNFWAQNPDSVSNLNFSYDPNNRDEKVRYELEKEATKRASRENSEYKFLSFDNDTLQYTLTDLEGNITKVTLVWNELYKQVATVSDKSIGAIDPVVAKIQEYEETLTKAVNNKYLKDDDSNLKGFTDSMNNIKWLIQGIKDGTETYETAKEKLSEYRQEAIKFGQDAIKTAKANEKLYTGTNELRSAGRQRDKIIGMFGEQFDDSSLPAIQQYKDEYQKLINLYNDLNENKKLYDTNEQENLRQQAVRVQAIGSQLLTSIKQAERLQQLADESGTFENNKGNIIKLGGTSGPLTQQINTVRDLKAAMLDYVQNGLKIADLEHINFNNRTKQLTGVVRTSKDTVAEIVVEYNKATNALYAYNAQEKESLTGLNAFIHGFKSKLRSILQYTASITSIYRVFGELKKGFQYVREIDSALTELKKVTDETEETYDRFLNTVAKTADKVGSTIKEVVSSTANWARLGYSLEDAAQLAESTSVLLNVSEFQSIDDATSALVSTMQAFGYAAEDSMRVVDVMNEIGNNYAVSSDGIATALQDSASSLMAANNSYQEAVALIASANKVVQDPNSVGSALRTISLRLRGTSTTDLENAGEETDGAITSKSKLRNKIKGLSGIDILTDSGAYKSTYEILLEISKVWDDMTDMNRAGLLEIIAGKTRSNTAAAILSNTEDLQNAYKDAMDAEGSALEENEKYLDSIQGRIDLFTNSVQTMWNTELDNGIIKFFVNLGTNLVKTIDKLGMINTLVFGLMSYLTIFKKNKIDLASLLGIHDIEKGWTFGKEGLTGWISNKFKKNSNKKIDLSNIFTPFDGDQISIFSDEMQTQIKLNDKIKQLNKAKEELKSLQKAKFKDIQIPDDALEYKVRNSKKHYLKEVLIPNKQAEIIAIEKDINDITQATKTKIQESKMELSELDDGQLMFGNVSKETTKATTKFLDIFENGLGKRATGPLKVDFDKLSGMLKEIDGMDGSQLRQYMTDLGNLGDEAGDTEIAFAGFVSTVEDGNYTIQGAQRYVRQYNQNLAQMSKQAMKAQIVQNLLNVAISAVAFGISAFISWVINKISQVQDEFEKLSSEISSLTSELNGLESELDNINEQIKELQDQGTLSFSEQEELDRLKAESKELENQINLKKTLQKQKQAKINQDAPNVAKKYYKKTGINSGKTTSEIAGQGAMIGVGIGGAIAAAVVSGIIAASGPIGLAIVGGIGIAAAGAGIGAGIGGIIGSSEEKVGESIDNMQTKYAELKQKYADAQAKYEKTLKDKDYEKAQKAQEQLTEFEGNMAQHLSELNEYYSQIDLDVETDPEKIRKLRKDMNDFYDTQDKWAILSGGDDAKVNAFDRIFGENADEGLKRVKQAFTDAAEEGKNISLEEAFSTAGLNTADLDAFISRLQDMGLYVFEAENYFGDLIAKEQEAGKVSLEGVATDIKKVSEGVESLKDAFNECIEGGSVTADTLVNLKEKFGDLGDTWDNYVNVMYSGVASTKEMTEATEELMKAYFDKQLLKGEPITETEQMTYVIQLKSLGVENADEYVKDKVEENTIKAIENSGTYNKDAVKNAFEELNNDDKSELGISGKKWEDLTDDEMNKIAERAKLQKEFSSERIKEIQEEYGVELDNIDEIINTLKEKEAAQQKISDLEKQQSDYNEWYEGDDGYRATEEKLNNLLQQSQAVKKALAQGNSVEDILGFSSDNWYMDYNEQGEEIIRSFDDKIMTPEDFYNMLQAHYDLSNSDFLAEYNKLQSRLEDLKKEGEEKGYIVNGKVINPDYKKQLDDAQKEFDDFTNKIETELTADIKLNIELQTKSNLVDDIQSVFDALAGAQKEYNENGYFSVDTLQSLLELKPKYLALLYDENGNLNLNKQTLYEVAQARLTDLGIQAQKNILETATTTATKGSIDAMRKLTDATYDGVEANEVYIKSQLGVIRSTLSKRINDPKDELYGQDESFIDNYIQGVTNQLDAVQRSVNIAKDNIANTLSSSGNTAKADTESALEKLQKRYEHQLSNLENQKTYVQNEIDRLEAEDKGVSKSYYEKQIAIEQQKMNVYKQERAALTNLLNSTKKGTDEWYEIANAIWETEHGIQSCATEMANLRKEIVELYQTVFDKMESAFGNMENLFSDRQSYIEKYMELLELQDEAKPASAYTDLIAQEEKKLANYEQELKNLIRIRDNAVASGYLKEGSDEWIEMTDAIREQEAAVLDSKVAIAQYNEDLKQLHVEAFEMVRDAFDARGDFYSAQQDYIEGYIDQLDAMNVDVPEEVYRDLIDIEKKKQENLQANIIDARQGLADLEAAGYTAADEEWQNANNRIIEYEAQQQESITKTIEWNNAIRELDFTKFDRFIEKLQDLNSELDNVYKLTSRKDVANEDGTWTEDGLTSLATMYQQYELSKGQAKAYGEEIDRLTEAYARGEMSENTYNERLKELTDGQWDAIQTSEDLKYSIIDMCEARVDLVEDGVQKEIEAMSELIELKKEELSAERD